MYMYMYRDARYTNCVMEHCYLLQIHTAYMYMCNYTGKCTSAEANDVHLFEGTTLFTQGLHDCRRAQPKRQHLNRPRSHVPLVVDLKKYHCASIVPAPLKLTEHQTQKDAL